LAPRSDTFEGQGQRSKVNVTKDKNGIFSALSAACVRLMFGKTSLAAGYKEKIGFVFILMHQKP